MTHDRCSPLGRGRCQRLRSLQQLAVANALGVVRFGHLGPIDLHLAGCFGAVGGRGRSAQRFFDEFFAAVDAFFDAVDAFFGAVGGFVTRDRGCPSRPAGS